MLAARPAGAAQRGRRAPLPGAYAARHLAGAADAAPARVCGQIYTSTF